MLGGTTGVAREFNRTSRAAGAPVAGEGGDGAVRRLGSPVTVGTLSGHQGSARHGRRLPGERDATGVERADGPAPSRIGRMRPAHVRAGRHAVDRNPGGGGWRKYQRPTPAVARAIPSRCATGMQPPGVLAGRRGLRTRLRGLFIAQTPASALLAARRLSPETGQTVIKKSRKRAWSAPATPSRTLLAVDVVLSR